MIYLGSHVSMKAPNYFLGSIHETIQYGANACMIYTGPPSNSKRVDTSKLKIDEAFHLMQENNISADHIIIHAPYIINLANSVKPEVAEFGVEFLKKEMLRVQKMGVKILVLHPGSHVKAGLNVGIEWIVRGLNQVLENDDSDVCIALETMSGKGSECGYTFDQLAAIRNGVEKNERIKICFDTCHVHDAGYDLSNFDEVLDEFDRKIGIEHLACMHINDSKNPCGAHKDRHENIGNGYIGFDTLSYTVHHPKLRKITKILETPFIDGKAPYQKEIKELLMLNPINS